MADTLRIGATVDVGGINEGMASVEDITRAASQNIAISFEEVSAKTKAAMRNLSDDVKQAADAVSKESIRVAEATKAQAEAFADLRRATLITKDSQIDASLAAKLLAAAQEKATVATAEKAAAQKRAAAAAAEAAEEEKLSNNSIVRSYQLMSERVQESISEAQEKLIVFAENGRLVGEGITSGFGALGELLGAGIAIEFFGHFLDETAKTNIELSHLSEKTGIAITSLAGLKQITKESGVEFDAVATGLVRMARAQELAKEGNTASVQGFERLGISIEQVKASSPDQLLQLVASRFAAIENPGKLAASAFALLGRGGQALIPILKQQGDHLTENMEKTGKLTGVTEESVAASVRWTRNMARLSAELQKFGNFAIENMHFVLGAFDAIGLGIQAVLETVSAALVSASHSITGVSRLIVDVLSGNYGAIKEDFRTLATNVSSDWRGAFTDIKNGWDEVLTHFRSQAPETPLPTGREDDTPDLGPKQKKTRDLSFQRDELELNEKRLAAARAGNEFLLVEEVRFWEGKLAAAKKGSDEYREILAKLAPLEEKLAKHKANPQIELAGTNIDAQVAAFIKGNQDEIKSNEQTQKQLLEAFRSSRDEEIRLDEERFHDLEQDTQFEVNQGRITAAERIGILKQAADEEYALRLSAVRAKEIVDQNDAAKYQQDLNRELEITRQHTRQIVLLNQQAAVQSEKAWERAYQQMTNELNRNVAQWVTTQRGFAQSMAQMLNGITQNFVQNVLKMTEQFLIGLALQKAGQKNQIFADAKTAAANTYASVSAIPIVGPFLAPPAAAAAFAGVLAFESFNEGGVVQQGGGYHVPILAKQGERVLTPSQNQNFESLVNNSRTSTQSNVVHARVTQNFAGNKTAGPREIISGIKDGMRRGKLSYSG